MHPALWGSNIGNSWRTTNDITDNFNRYYHMLLLPFLTVVNCILLN